jgi:hypothetical protein
MRFHRRLLCLVLVLAPELLASAQAPQTVDKLPDPFRDGPIAGWIERRGLKRDPRYKAAFFAAHKQALEAGRLESVLRALADDFRTKVWPVHAATQRRVADEIERYSFDFAEAVAEAAPDGLLDSLDEQNALIAELRERGRGVQDFEPQLIGPEQRTELVFFDREGQPEQRVTAYKNLSTDTEDRYELLLTDDEMVDLRMRCDALTHFLTERIRDVRKANVAELELAVARWENYLDHGYSMYPWESWLNGKWLDIPSLGPPDDQFIVMHPGLGVELWTRGFDDLDAKETLNLEVFGYLHYHGERYENYYGGSLALTLREDLGPGLGALFHFSESWNLGVTWHDVDDDGRYFDDSPFVFFSLDLYRFVEKPASLFTDAFARDRDALAPYLGR